MARAETRTWLPLDRWAELLGINPLFFNQLQSDTYFTNRTTCGHVFFQNNWHRADRISREMVSRAIREAELQIAEYVGYNLLPDWTVDERIQMPRPAVPELYSINGRNPRGLYQSVSPHWGYMISGGIRTKTGIETAAVTRSDEDGDGYAETVTVTVGTSVTDPDEIKVYYPGEDGADDWEIRPIDVSIAANVATITFKSWQIIDPDLQTALDAENIDADAAASYLTTVDVYRVYNDPSEQLRFLTEWDGFSLFNNCSCTDGTCTTCQLNSQTGCFIIRDRRLGMIVPQPATWDASTSSFTKQTWGGCRQADQIRLWYYSGFRDSNNGFSKTKMAYFWEQAVARMAAARLDRDTCGCDNLDAQIRHWRSDRAFASQGEGANQMTPKELGNPFGTTNGEIYAWQQANMEGRRVMR